MNPRKFQQLTEDKEVTITYESAVCALYDFGDEHYCRQFAQHMEAEPVSRTAVKVQGREALRKATAYLRSERFDIQQTPHSTMAEASSGELVSYGRTPIFVIIQNDQFDASDIAGFISPDDGNGRVGRASARHMAQAKIPVWYDDVLLGYAFRNDDTTMQACCDISPNDGLCCLGLNTNLSYHVKRHPDATGNYEDTLAATIERASNEADGENLSQHDFDAMIDQHYPQDKATYDNRT